jgi:hypothetical protein
MLHLPALMRNEVEQTRPALIPGPSELAVRVPAPWLPDAQWPVIDRYLLTRPREQSQVHLVSDRGDVIVASMTVGAGKVVAVTSGFASWTTDWLQSSEWPELASGLARYLTTRESGAFDVSVDTHAALLTVDAANRPLEGTAVATVVNPSDTVTTVALEPHSPGRIAATLDLDEAGQYLVVVEDGATSTRYRFINVLGSPAQLVETDDASRPHDRTNWQLWLSVLALLSFVALLVRERWSPNSRLWLPDWSTRSRRRPY